MYLDATVYSWIGPNFSDIPPDSRVVMGRGMIACIRLHYRKVVGRRIHGYRRGGISQNICDSVSSPLAHRIQPSRGMTPAFGVIPRMGVLLLVYLGHCAGSRFVAFGEIRAGLTS